MKELINIMIGEDKAEAMSEEYQGEVL